MGLVMDFGCLTYHVCKKPLIGGLKDGVLPFGFLYFPLKHYPRQGTLTFHGPKTKTCGLVALF